ncbi:hypothetical protein EVJ58_g4226 [Rhodofomes roseus]|uniref:Uncharacterized protein n=1 Tax=Rhodofomes roseus TaxID=34475 RepID=A0A4Y9YH25_9APHY|nr:hypothetical protein EVJ58_g4226 [Rhodofomes roseus]
MPSGLSDAYPAHCMHRQIEGRGRTADAKRSLDESLHMMSGMLAALAPTSGGSVKNPDLVEHTTRLVIRLQDPYLRAMLTYLTVMDWSEVLQEEVLPLRERLAIAFHFLDDRDLGSYLHRVADRSSHDGSIEGLIVTGLSFAALDILQSYVDVTGDVQTAAILSSMTPTGAHDTRASHWLDAYRDLLDGWKLFHHRCQFDVDRGRMLKDAQQNTELDQAYEWAPRQILLRCNYCNKSIDSAPPRSTEPYSSGYCLPSLRSSPAAMFRMSHGTEHRTRLDEKRSIDALRLWGHY